MELPIVGKRPPSEEIKGRRTGQGIWMATWGIVLSTVPTCTIGRINEVAVQLDSVTLA